MFGTSSKQKLYKEKVPHWFKKPPAGQVFSSLDLFQTINGERPGHTINKLSASRIFVEDNDDNTNPFISKYPSNDSISGINTTANTSSNNNYANRSRLDSASSKFRKDVMQKLQGTISSKKSWKNDDLMQSA